MSFPSDSAKPLISVIVPVYNAEAWLEQCLESIIRQTYTALQIICIDDASSDNSFAILSKYAALDPRIELIRQESNKGLSAARNAGISKARGEWITGVDSDDYLTEEAYSKLISQLHPQADIVCFGASAVDENGKTLKFNLLGKTWDGIQSPTDVLTRHTPPMFQLKLWKRSFLTKWKLMFVEGCIHEDEILWHQASAVATQIQYINDKVYFYRRHEGSIMSRSVSAVEKAVDYCRVLESIARFYKQHHLMSGHFGKILNLMGVFYDSVLKRSQSLSEKKEVRTCFRRVIQHLGLPRDAHNAYPIRELEHPILRWNPFYQRAQGKISFCILFLPIWTRRLRKNGITWRLCGIPVFKKSFK